MSTSQLVSEYLPLMRRYARAVTGRQSSGDAYAPSTMQTRPTFVPTSRWTERASTTAVLTTYAMGARPMTHAEYRACADNARASASTD